MKRISKKKRIVTILVIWDRCNNTLKGDNGSSDANFIARRGPTYHWVYTIKRPVDENFINLEVEKNTRSQLTKQPNLS